MKSRSSVSTVLMMSASLVALTACEEPKVDASIFKSVEQCKSDPLTTSDQCESRFKEAQSQHVAVRQNMPLRPIVRRTLASVNVK